MKLPAARHICNHVLVQELAMLAALTATLTSSPVNGQMQGDAAKHNLYKAAEAVAHSTMAIEEELSYSPTRKQQQQRGHARLGPVALTAILRRLAHLRRNCLRLPPRPEGSDGSRLPVMSPGRFVALYAPHAVLPPLPAFAHDPVTFDEAAHHLKLLQRLLGPLGLQVSLNGLTRLGCPVGPEAEFILALTPEAAEEIAAMKVDTAEDRARRQTQQLADEKEWRARRRREAQRVRRRCEPPDASAVEQAHGQDAPQQTPPTAAMTAASRHADGFAVAVRPASPAALRGLRTVRCTHADVVAVADVLPARVVHRHRRAVQALHNAGCLQASATTSFSFAAAVVADGEEREAVQRRARGAAQVVRGSMRFDPANPSTPPPFHVTDALQLQRLRLHRVALSIVPTEVFLVRRFFQTGPAAFTAHVTLRALGKGFELNMNGMFLRVVGRGTEADRAEDDAASPSSCEYHRVILHSEVELFALVGMPYVDPIGRGIYCQDHNITMAAP